MKTERFVIQLKDIRKRERFAPTQKAMRDKRAYRRKDKHIKRWEWTTYSAGPRPARAVLQSSAMCMSSIFFVGMKIFLKKVVDYRRLFAIL